VIRFGATGRKARGQRHKRLGTHKSAISIMATKPPNVTIGTRPAPADRSKVNEPARRSKGRVVYVAALLAIGSAGGLWAYQRLGRPGDIDALWAEAEADFVAGRYDRVDIALKRLGRLRKPSPLDWMLRGQYAAARKQPERALAALAHVPDQHYMAAQARLLAGQIELRRDRVRLAEAWFQTALGLDPKLVQAHRELIFIFGMQLRRAELSAQFLALSGLVPLTSDNVFHWCLLRSNSWEPGEAVATLLRYVSADPLDRWSRLALAENYRRMGQNDTAQSVLAPLPAEDSAAAAVRSQIAIDRQKLDEAERLLAEGASDDPALERLRGRLALSKRDAKGAWHHFQIAFKSDPEDRETVFGLVYALELAGQSRAAEPFRELVGKLERLSTLIHRAATPQARQDPALLRELGGACAALHRDPEARAWYELAIALDPFDSESHRALYRLRDQARATRPDPPPLPASILQPVKS
jgi:tetratricopeptide (TPR) repeat protein